MTFRNFMAYTLGGGWRIYTKHYGAKIEVDAGYYKGRLWKIVSCNGIYPLVYIEGDEDVYRDDVQSPAHGGITFRGPKFEFGMPKAIGYDYCHSDDYLMVSTKHMADPALMRRLMEGKLHSMRDIRKNIRKTIDWLNRWEAEHGDLGGND